MKTQVVATIVVYALLATGLMLHERDMRLSAEQRYKVAAEEIDALAVRNQRVHKVLAERTQALTDEVAATARLKEGIANDFQGAVADPLDRAVIERLCSAGIALPECSDPGRADGAKN